MVWYTTTLLFRICRQVHCDFFFSAAGCVITRSESSEQRRREMGSSGVLRVETSAAQPAAQKRSKGDSRMSGNSHSTIEAINCPYLVQANLDHWIQARTKDDSESLPRVRLVHDAFHSQTAAVVRRPWFTRVSDLVYDSASLY